MKEKIEALIILLEQEKEFYAQLLSISLEEQNILVSGKIDELDEKVRKKEKLILEVNKLEKARESLSNEFSSIYNVPGEELTLTKLAELFPENYTSKLKELQVEILDTIKKLNEVNKSSQELIKDSLSFLDFSLNIIRSEKESPIYREDAKTDEKVESNFLNAKV